MNAALTARSFADLKPLRRALELAAAQQAERERLRREAEKRAKEGPKRDQDRNRQQNDNNSNFNAAGGMFNNFR